MKNRAAHHILSASAVGGRPALRLTPRSLAIAVALLGASGCAQWTRNVSEPSPMERNFSHPLLADRGDYYPKLAGTAAQPAPAPAEGRRPITSAAPTVAEAHRPLTVGRADARVAAATPRERTAPTAATVELDSTRSGLAFAGDDASALDIAAVPERPRAPKATVDVGLGDPGTAPSALESAAVDERVATARAPLTFDAPSNPRKAEGPDADAAREAVDFDPLEAPAAAPEAPARAVRPAAEPPRSRELGSPAGSMVGDGTAATEALAAAQRLLGVKTPWDEGRFLAHLMAAADLDVRASDSTGVIRAVHEHLETEGLVFGPGNSPDRGDLVFFSNTFDRDDDGRADDWYTMVGIVESVDDGTITFIGVTQGEVRRMVLNLDRPGAEAAGDGTPLNSQLRQPSLADRPFTKYLAGELLVGFGRLPDEFAAH